MKTNKELQQEFWKFLRKKGLTRKFKKNNKISIEHNGYGNNLEDALNNNISETIDRGFTWSKAPEGRTFWERINREWKNYIEKNTTGLTVSGYPVVFHEKGDTIRIGCHIIHWQTVKNIHKEILKLEKSIKNNYKDCVN